MLCSRLKALTNEEGVGGSDSSLAELRGWLLALLVQTMARTGGFRLSKLSQEMGNAKVKS